MKPTIPLSATAASNSNILAVIHTQRSIGKLFPLLSFISIFLQLFTFILDMDVCNYCNTRFFTGILAKGGIGWGGGGFLKALLKEKI